MQVKPRFETYKIIEQHPILKDDTGNEMCLTLLEVKLPSNEDEVMESPYRFWTVIGKNQHQWLNKAVSYDGVAYWRSQQKDKLFNDVVNGFAIEEKEHGEHSIIDKNTKGSTTIFKISRNKQ